MEVKSEIAGKVWQVVGQPGDTVAAEQTIVVLESMKMEIPVDAPVAGTIETVHVSEGESVLEGQLIATLKV